MKCKTTAKTPGRLLKAALALFIGALFSAGAVMPLCAAYEDSELLGRISTNDLSRGLDGRFTDEAVFGAFAAEAVMEATGADFALVNSGDLSDRGLKNGEVTYGNVRESLANDRELAVVTVTTEQLVELLECSASYYVVDMEKNLIDQEASENEGYVQLAGLSVVYDVSAMAGKRVLRLYNADGDELYPEPEVEDRSYTLAASAYMLSGGYDMPALEGAEAVGTMLSEAIADYISARGEIGDYDAGHISTVGTNDDPLISKIPIWAVCFAIAFFTLANLLVHRADKTM